MKNAPEYHPTTDDLLILLRRAECWAAIATGGDLLQRRDCFHPVEISCVSPMIAAAMEVFNWLETFQQGKELLLSLNKGSGKQGEL